MTPLLRVERVGKTFRGARGRPDLEVLRDISFDVAGGEFVSVIGPSGCGKTTLLRIIHGLERASAGAVLVNGEPVSGPAASRAMVFQHFNLFPWLTVLENVTFGLEVARVPPAECARRAERFVRLVGLASFSAHYPHELSGGMQQRVGLARAFALEPALLLMDEPFGSLDAITREQLERESAAIWLESPRAAVLVTHDMDEAIFFSDRILVLSARPARILEEVAVDLPRPRDPAAIRRVRRGAAIRERLWSLLSRGAGRS